MKYFAVVFLLVASAAADVVYYEGRLSVDGVPFQGEGRFKFALVGDQGATLWASTEMRLDVREGAYAVRLGDSAQAPTIGAAVFRGAVPPKLRISFFREGKGWGVAGEDVALNGGRPGMPNGGPRPGVVASGEVRELRAIPAAPRPLVPLPGPQSVTVPTGRQP